MLKKDNWILGIALGVGLPALVYALIFWAVKYWGTIDETLNIYIVPPSTMQLVGIFVNMFTFRYYMVNLKFDKTGRGILLATFVWAGIFVYQHLL
jgi:hypothetical protein